MLVCVLSDSSEALRFSARSSAGRLLPATHATTLGAVHRGLLPGAAGVAVGGMIHKVWHLFGSKEVNCARDGADCICPALLMCLAGRQKGGG